MKKPAKKINKEIVVIKKKPKGCIHIEYTRVYHDVLAYADVTDIPVGDIYQVFLKTIAELRSVKDLTVYPLKEEIDAVTSIVLKKLGVES